MELYLRWLAKHEQQPGEEVPIGLPEHRGPHEKLQEKVALDQIQVARVAQNVHL